MIGSSNSLLLLVMFDTALELVCKDFKCSSSVERRPLGRSSPAFIMQKVAANRGSDLTWHISLSIYIYIYISVIILASAPSVIHIFRKNRIFVTHMCFPKKSLLKPLFLLCFLGARFLGQVVKKGKFWTPTQKRRKFHFPVVFPVFFLFFCLFLFFLFCFFWCFFWSKNGPKNGEVNLLPFLGCV